MVYADAFVEALADERVELGRIRLFRSAEFDARAFGDGDTLRLPRADVGAFVFGDEGQHLQDDVRNKLAYERFALVARVQKGHVQHENVRPDFLGDGAPFLDDCAVIPPEAVDGFDDEQISPPQLGNQPLIGGAFEILSALFVAEDKLFGDSELAEFLNLAGQVLVCGGYSCVSIGHWFTP